jgi:hypothetical protein
VDGKIKIINNIVEQKTEYPCAVEVVEQQFNIIKFSIIFGIFNNKECLRILPPTLTGQSRHGLYYDFWNVLSQLIGKWQSVQ